MSKTIHVSKADIKHGVRYDCGKCPLARALTRALRCDVRVGVNKWRFGFSATLFKLPPKAVKFRMDFDCGCPVEPFSFTATYR